MEHIETIGLDSLLKEREIVALTGLSRATIWRMEKENRFPSRRSISKGRVGWLKSDIYQWMKFLPKARSKPVM